MPLRGCLASPDAALPGTITFASRIGRRFGSFGGFRVAALRRARLAPLGAALLSIIFFASRFSCRFGGWGSLITDAIEARALALASLAQRWTPLRSKQFTWLRKQSPR